MHINGTSHRKEPIHRLSAVNLLYWICACWSIEGKRRVSCRNRECFGKRPGKRWNDLAYATGHGRIVWCWQIWNKQASEKYICHQRIGRKRGSCKNCNNHSSWCDSWENTTPWNHFLPQIVVRSSKDGVRRLPDVFQLFCQRRHCHVGRVGIAFVVADHDCRPDAEVTAQVGWEDVPVAGEGSIIHHNTSLHTPQSGQGTGTHAGQRCRGSQQSASRH